MNAKQSSTSLKCSTTLIDERIVFMMDESSLILSKWTRRTFSRFPRFLGVTFDDFSLWFKFSEKQTICWRLVKQKVETNECQFRVERKCSGFLVVDLRCSSQWRTRCQSLFESTREGQLPMWPARWLYSDPGRRSTRAGTCQLTTNSSTMNLFALGRESSVRCSLLT